MSANPWDWPRERLVQFCGSVEQLASVTRFCLAEGRAKGVEAIRVETGGGLGLTMLVDRALDLGEVRFRGHSLAWLSPAGVVHPAYYERDGSGWLRSFGGGLLVTCGLRNVGPGSVEGWETFGLHGEISCSPAIRTAVDCRWEGDRYLIEIHGEIREAYPFGPHLCLRRTWRTELGADWIELEDRVVNEGFRAEVHMQLYHWNFGFPMFTPTSELHLTTDAVRPRDKAALAGIERHRLGDEPTRDASEQIFVHRHRATRTPEKASVALVADRESGARGVELSYDTADLPYLVQWKLCRPGEYVCGIEPGNCLVEGRKWHRAQNLALLEPGEARHYRLRLAVLDGSTAVSEAIGRCCPRDEVVVEPMV